jgi:23S rRNA (uracil1939-C5)-methyltransferase
LVERNSVYILDISGMNHDGQGVGRIDNFTVFVDGAVPGEKVEVRLTTVKKTYAVGELARIISASPKRVSPACAAFPKCGGCSLQHMSYDAQLEFKTGLVKDSIKRMESLTMW